MTPKSKSRSNTSTADSEKDCRYAALTAIILAIIFAYKFGSQRYESYLDDKRNKAFLSQILKSGERLQKEMEAKKRANEEYQARSERLMNANPNAPQKFDVAALEAQAARWTDKNAAPLRLRSEGNADWAVDADAEASRKAGTRQTLTLYGDNPADDVELAFRWIPAGTFLYGSPLDEPGRSKREVVQRRATVERGFWLLETETTERMEMRLNRCAPVLSPDRLSTYAVAGSVLANDRLRPLVYSYPTERVDWFDALRFCRRLNKLDGKPVGLKFRLPTEIEWERACRAGASTPYDGGTKLSVDDAHFLLESSGSSFLDAVDSFLPTLPANVARFKPNAWGLYDMRGNVAEICAIDPDAPPLYDGEISEKGRKFYGYGCYVLRGGSRGTPSDDCRSASRARPSILPSSIAGFRIALVPDDETPPYDEEAEGDFSLLTRDQPTAAPKIDDATQAAETPENVDDAEIETPETSEVAPGVE